MEWLSRIEMRSLLCSSLSSLSYESMLWPETRRGRRDYVWLIWGQLLVSPKHQMSKEEWMSKRCEHQWLLEGWEGNRGRRLKCLLAASQLECDRHNLSHTCSAWRLGWVLWVFGNTCGPPLKVCCGCCCCDSVSKLTLTATAVTAEHVESTKHWTHCYLLLSGLLSALGIFVIEYSSEICSVLCVLASLCFSRIGLWRLIRCG